MGTLVATIEKGSDPQNEESVRENAGGRFSNPICGKLRGVRASVAVNGWKVNLTRRVGTGAYTVSAGKLQG